MSIIVIQIGQCGNQIGQQLFCQIENEILLASPGHQAAFIETFFHYNQQNTLLYPNAILIDMEPKVINQCLAMQGKFWKYNEKLTFMQQEGSGNNWAYGYSVHGQKNHSQIKKLINNLLEKLDMCQGFLVLQSLAGGTGSGVGSYIIENILQTEFKEIPCISVAVIPHIGGEVILQSYNCVLTISHLQKHCQGMIMIENDQIWHLCDKLLNYKKTSLNLMNSLIAFQLSSVLLPCFPQKQIFSILQSNYQFFDDILTTLLLNPDYKLLTLHNAPILNEDNKKFFNDSWSSLEKQIERSISQYKSKIIQIGNVVICRGQSLIYGGKDDNFNSFTLLKDSLNYKNNDRKYATFVDSHNFNNVERSISAISNSSILIQSMEKLIIKAHLMFDSKAYLHQYEKYNIDSDYFFESLSIFEQILSNYQNF